MNATLGKPLHLVLAVWGGAYARTFLDLYVSTLLAEGNAPALGNAGGHRLRVFTPADGAPGMEKSHALRVLARHIAVEFVDIARPCGAHQPAAVRGRAFTPLQDWALQHPPASGSVDAHVRPLRHRAPIRG